MKAQVIVGFLLVSFSSFGQRYLGEELRTLSSEHFGAAVSDLRGMLSLPNDAVYSSHVEINVCAGTRFEYRSIDGDEKWRWREKVKISHPIVLGNLELSPYLSEEFFYDFKTDEYNQNRAVIGVAKKLSSNVELDLYYMYKANLKSSGWSGVNVLGTGMTIVF